MQAAVIFAALIAAATVHGAPIDSQKLRFKISARDLPDKDTLGTIDPYVEVYTMEDGKKEETLLGRTGTITDQENPDWGDVFELDFDRAKHQRFKFLVYDHDNAREDDKAGQAYVDVAEFVDKNQRLNLNLNKKGYLILSSVDPIPAAHPPQQVVQTVPVVQPIHTVPYVQPATVPLVPTTGGVLIVPQPQTVTVPDKARLKFKLSASNLPDKDNIGSTDPYVELYFTEGANTQEKKFAKSATIDNNKNPQWGEVFEFDYDRSKQQKWLFKIYDYDQGREDDSAGKVWVEVNDYVQKGQALTVNLSKRGTLSITNADTTSAAATPSPVVSTVPLQQVHPAHVPLVSPVVTPVVQSPAAIQVSNPLARIKFKLSANGLDDKDILGTSDPYVKVFSKVGSEPERLIQNTAKLTDTENPVWPDSIDFEYDPSKSPKLHFVVLDDDEGRRDDELGDAWLDVNEYVQKNQDQSIGLKKGSLNVRKI